MQSVSMTAMNVTNEIVSLVSQTGFFLKRRVASVSVSKAARLLTRCLPAAGGKHSTSNNYLFLLALPRGIEPLFQP
jgi:hypothetical protein